MPNQVTALVVDDEEMNRVIVAGYLSRLGYATVGASDGREAWRLLRERPRDFHVVLLDRWMPGMDGMEFLALLRTDPDLSQIPVIMQTISDGTADVAEAIQAGVFYYLVKPYDGDLLRSVAAAAVEDYTRLVRLEGDVRARCDAMMLLRSGSFRFRTPKEAHNLAITLAAASPNGRRLAFGLMELLMNAVEHGNLGIGYEAKTELKASNLLGIEIEERLARPENRDKHATLDFARDDERIVFTIADQGPGFDWQRYIEVDPRGARASHGRGIALARSVSFDRIEYLGRGNMVRGVVDLARHAGGGSAA